VLVLQFPETLNHDIGEEWVTKHGLLNLYIHVIYTIRIRILIVRCMSSNVANAKFHEPLHLSRSKERTAFEHIHISDLTWLIRGRGDSKTQTCLRRQRVLRLRAGVATPEAAWPKRRVRNTHMYILYIYIIIM